MDAAVVLGLRGDLRAGAFGAALAPLAALGGDRWVGLQLPGGVSGSGRGGGGRGRAPPRKRAQFGVRAAVSHPVGLVGVGEWGGLVVVMGRGVRVVVGAVRFGAVAELSDAARLGPARLGVVERSGTGHGLTCDGSGGRGDVRVGENEAVFAQKPVRPV